MKELDLLLLGYLERNYLNADAIERSSFEVLLDQEDDLLWGWLLGRLQPEDPVLRRILAQIRAHASPAP